MNLLKILKSYLIFILAITAMASLSYIDSVRNFANGQFASVIDAMGHNDQKSGSTSFAYTANYDWENLREEKEGSFEVGNKNENLISFEINPANDGAFAAPGTSGAPMMDLAIISAEEELELNGFKFKIVGVEADQVKKAYIFDGEKLIALGSRRGEYLNFEGLNIKFAKGKENRLSVKMDVGSKLKTGERIRLDIEKPEDIDLKVGGEPYLVNSYYPIKGEYLTISKPRPWTRPDKKV